jgi:hypothetical protein
MSPCSMAARYGRSSDSQIARTVPCVADFGFRAMPAAISWARSHSCSRATTSVTNPIRNAVSALTRSSLPMSAIRRVSPKPTFRIKPTGSIAETRP